MSSPSVSLDEQARSQIIKWLHATEMTQTELASRINKNQAWLSRYLKGEYAADLETLYKMAGVFGHTLAQLFDIPPDPEEATIIALYRGLRPENRRHVLGILKTMNRVSDPHMPR